jgi:hypothetical protein
MPLAAFSVTCPPQRTHSRTPRRPSSCGLASSVFEHPPALWYTLLHGQLLDHVPHLHTVHQ